MKPAPLDKKLLTPGVIVLLFLMGMGAIAIIARFIGGIGYISNLSDARPWGLWVGVDVASGVALAAGGFTTATIAHIFGKHYYEPVTRPALLTAMLGYTFVVLGLIVDIGRSWAIWKPMFNWNYNSALFEVAMCVMVYLNVLYIEFLPIVIEQYKDKVNLPIRFLNAPFQKFLQIADKFLDKTIWIFIILGTVLSCMHQSSLGSLMLIAPTKIHPLWYTPILPLLFLLSAFSVGFPMVIFESTIATSSFNLEPETKILSNLVKVTIVLLGIYMSVKIGDMMYRGTYKYLLDGTFQTNSFIIEFFGGVVLPFFLLLSNKVRTSGKGLFITASLIVFGVLLNRINVFIVAFTPPVSKTSYFPAVGEILVTVGLVATLMFVYRVIVTYLPILPKKAR